MADSSRRKRTRVCFVTGTRAEFGLMRTTLEAIRAHPGLTLQLLVTGMHLDRRHGRSIDLIRKQGWTIDSIVPWKATRTPSALAMETAWASARMAAEFERLGSDIVLLVGDRVEPFAAAGAAHLSQRIVAHIHGGDRAAGQIDDALRHAITKLAHIHFPATASSAMRLLKLGEDGRRIHQIGAPGIDGIRKIALSASELRERYPSLKRGRFALLVLHPLDATGTHEAVRARNVLQAIAEAGIAQIVVVYPNNDPGGDAIIDTWERNAPRFAYALRDVDRPSFLALLRDAAVVIGNSSSGIIEAASFGTAVVNVGDRQKGRERGANVTDVTYDPRRITVALSRVWRKGQPARFAARNVYGGARTGRRIAETLAKTDPDDPRIRHKLIAY